MRIHVRSMTLVALTMYAVVCSACTGKAVAQEHSITVVGNATVHVVPDQARLSFSVVSHGNTLKEAKQLHDSAVQKAQEIFGRHAVEAKDITLENLTIAPRYSYRSDTPQFLYYEIMQNISVVISKLEQYELFLTDLINSGIDRINDVRFSARDFEKYKDEARRDAVKAAKEKAKLLCEAAADEMHKPVLGKILRITELSSFSDSERYNAMQQNRIAYMKADGGGSDEQETLIGKIRFSAQVEMVFELK